MTDKEEDAMRRSDAAVRQVEALKEDIRKLIKEESKHREIISTLSAAENYIEASYDFLSKGAEFIRNKNLNDFESKFSIAADCINSAKAYLKHYQDLVSNYRKEPPIKLDSIIK